eukprot:575236-Pelagomonas_calceolata.AAC.1
MSRESLISSAAGAPVGHALGLFPTAAGSKQQQQQQEQTFNLSSNHKRFLCTNLCTTVLGSYNSSRFQKCLPPQAQQQSPWRHLCRSQ